MRVRNRNGSIILGFRGESVAAVSAKIPLDLSRARIAYAAFPVSLAATQGANHGFFFHSFSSFIFLGQVCFPEEKKRGVAGDISKKGESNRARLPAHSVSKKET